MMEFKNIDSLSITECCEFLKINRQDLPEVVQSLEDLKGLDKLVVARLNLLLNADKAAIEACENIEQYEKYLSTWPDGLYHHFAKHRIAQLKAETEEHAFYEKHKGRIWGCKKYLKKYPDGKYSGEIRSILRRKRRVRNITFFGIIISALVIWGIFSYEPLPTIDIPSKINVSQYGDTIGFDMCVKDDSLVVQEGSQNQYSEDNLLFSLQKIYDEVEKKEIGDFVFYRVRTEHEYEILDSTGNVLIPKTDYIRYYREEDVFVGVKKGIYSVYSRTGDIIIPDSRGYTSCYMEHLSDNKRFYYIVSREAGKVGVCDKDGNVIIEPVYADVGYSENEMSTFYYQKRYNGEYSFCYIYLDEANVSQHYPEPIAHYLYVRNRFYVKEEKRWVESKDRYDVLIYNDSIIVSGCIYPYWGTVDGKKYFKRDNVYIYFDVNDNLIQETEYAWSMFQKNEVE